MPKPTIFISYSHKDEEWKDRLVTHLGVLHNLEIWDDRRIAGGDDWLPEIEKAINKTQIAVLMISANFLTSKFILGKEIPALMQRRQKDNLRVMPMIVKPCAWQTVDWLSPINARPKDGRPLSGGNEHQIDTDFAAFATEIYELLKRVPEQPAIEGEQISIPPRKIETTKLPVTSVELFGREKELALLDNAWDNPKTRILSFVAWGGVGKSALINAWLNKIEENHYKHAELVYGWSFYSQGTKEKGQSSADGFINDAIKWFGHIGDIPTSQFERARLLSDLIVRQKTLLILDGLEPLQYPPGEMHGFLKDKSMPPLLKNLVRNMNGLCIITSRCQVEDLNATEGMLSHTHELEHLSDEAGMAVLKSHDLKGTDEEFKQTSREFKGHALALHLAGGYLKAYHNGDIKQRREIPKLILDERQGGHARRVMESYEKWFADKNQAELDVLYLLGLFDRPAAKAAIDVLRAELSIPGLTDRLQNLTNRDWLRALNHLRDLRLLAAKDEYDPDALDCHPLIREHFGDKLQQHNPEAWQQAHARLYDYYKKLPEKELPDTLEEMEPLFAAVMHGCLAGRHQQTMVDVLWKRICRNGEYYSLKKLGAYGADLSCLSNLFETLWDMPAIGLNDFWKAETLAWTGFALRAVGRLSEAAKSMKGSLKIRIEEKNWKESAIDTNNLSELYLTLGDITTAQNYGAQSVNFADRSGDGLMKEVTRRAYADSYHQAGNVKEAEKLYKEAEELRKKRQPEHPYLYSLEGFQYCDLLLSMGKYQDTLERARTTVKYENKSWYNLLAIALDKLTIGRTLMLQIVENNSLDFNEAELSLNQAVDSLQEAGEQEFLVRGLLTRTILYRHQKEFLKSWFDLDEAREISEYGQMRLLLTDYHLEACRVISAQLTAVSRQPSAKSYEVIENGEEWSLTCAEMQARFRQHFKEAERLISETGYHRRDEELEALRV